MGDSFRRGRRHSPARVVGARGPRVCVLRASRRCLAPCSHHTTAPAPRHASADPPRSHGTIVPLAHGATHGSVPPAAASMLLALSSTDRLNPLVVVEDVKNVASFLEKTCLVDVQPGEDRRVVTTGGRMHLSAKTSNRVRSPCL